jgi:hypothetical protein
MAQLAAYDIGDSPVFTVTFRNISEVVTDPTTVTFMWRVPAGTETSYVYGVASEVAKTSTGVYTFTPPTIAVSGQHSIRAKGVGAIVAAVDATVGVRLSGFTTP